MPYRSVNPANGEVLKTFTEHTDAQADVPGDPQNDRNPRTEEGDD